MVDGNLEIRVDTTVNLPSRGENVAKLLDLLKEQDPLFEYNVPSVLRTEASDEVLMRALDAAYSKPTFVITDPIQVERYLQRGDFVLAKDKIIATLPVKENPKGRLVSINDETETIEVMFDAFKDRIFNLPFRDCFVKVLLDGYKPLEYSTRRGLLPKHKILYKGNRDKLEDPWFIIPKGSKGVISQTFDGQRKNAFVYWINEPGLVQGQNYNSYPNSSSRHAVPLYTIPTNQLDIIRKNYVAFQELKKQAFGDIAIIEA